MEKTPANTLQRVVVGGNSENSINSSGEGEGARDKTSKYLHAAHTPVSNWPNPWLWNLNRVRCYV